MSFTEWMAERILKFKTEWLIFRINMGFIDNDTYKILGINYYLDYLARLVRGKCITFTEACELLDIASQKIQLI